jgi:hypothetical protein
LAAAPTMTCDDIVAGQREDGAVDPIVEDGCNSICPEGFHLVHGRVATMLNVMGKEIRDYHFARRNHDGTWTHMRGDYPVSNLDASGRVIHCAQEADWNFGPNGNYKDDCGNLCHPAPTRLPQADWWTYAEPPIAALALVVPSVFLLYRKAVQANAPLVEMTLPKLDLEILEQLVASTDGLSQSQIKKGRREPGNHDIQIALQRMEKNGWIRKTTHPVRRHEIFVSALPPDVAITRAPA